MKDRKTALVTGASRGIGRDIAIRLAKDGYMVIINSRRADSENHETGAYEVKKTIEDGGGEAVITRADISIKEERDKMLDFVINDIGRVDLLVNNAGIEPPFLDMLESTEERYDNVMNTNLKGPYFITQQIAKKMIEWHKSGIIDLPRIIFITSVQAYICNPNGAEYTLTKAALHMAMKNYAARLGKDDINVFEISPGIIYTDMSKIHEENLNKRLKDGDFLISNRWGMVEEISKLVSFIAGGGLDYSTGSTIEVGGGLGIARL